MSGRGSDKLAAVFEAAQAKLNENAHKGAWEEERLYDLIYLFDREIAEFKRAIARRQASGRHGALDELADIVNYGTMIADKLGAFEQSTHSCSCRVHDEKPASLLRPLSSDMSAPSVCFGSIYETGACNSLTGTREQAWDKPLREGDIEC